MNELLRSIEAWFTVNGANAAVAAVILLVGLFTAKAAPARFPVKKLHPQHQLVVQRLTRYAITAVTLGLFLQAIGINLGILLGAAGILTVAIGFAAQTSASNLISGLFLMLEQPFRIEDIITVDGITGTVVSIDLLSVRLSTFDNVLTRIPNETMLKSNVTNLTYFPIRRLDIPVGVAYKENIAAVREILMEVAYKNPICLEEPKPLIFFQGFGDSSIDLQFSVWATRENYMDLKNSIYQETKDAFDANGIEIPFPHISLYAGSRTMPLPVKLKSDDT